MGKHMIPFATVKEGERDLIDLAFSKKKADDRKEWLRQLEVRCNMLYQTEKRLNNLYSRAPSSTTLQERVLSPTSSTGS